MSSGATSVSLRDYFREIDDPRIERSKVHPLPDLFFLSVAATLAGADGPSDIEAFGKERLDWLRRIVDPSWRPQLRGVTLYSIAEAAHSHPPTVRRDCTGLAPLGWRRRVASGSFQLRVQFLT